MSGTPKPTLYRWLKQGVIPALHLGPGGRSKRVPRDVFMKILEKSAKGLGIEDVLVGHRWVTTRMPGPRVRRVPAGAALDIIHHPEPARRPFLDSRTVHRLAKLERRYRIGSASLLAKLEEGEQLPSALPKKTAQEWVGVLTRTIAR